MCVTCKIPLNVAESSRPTASVRSSGARSPRADDEAEVKDALVGQYGATVLGLPGAHGFDLTAYLVPLAAVLALAATLLTLLPRWRRSARAQDAAAPSPPASAPRTPHGWSQTWPASTGRPPPPALHPLQAR